MTSNGQPTWQQSLNPKLVRRLNSPLAKPGIIDNQMAKKIIDRSPDLLDRLPLLAQQMQRWSTIIDLESEQIPIVYVEARDRRNNPIVPSAEPDRGKKQLPVVKAKLAQPRTNSVGQNQEKPFVDARSQPTAPALKQDNSLLNLPKKTTSIAESSATNLVSNKRENSELNPSISVTQISSDASSNPIQRQLSSEQLAQANEWVKLDPEMPVVYEESPPKLSESIPEKPLVNLSNTVDQTNESSSPTISVTPISNGSTNPIQRRLESEQLSQANQSVEFSQEMPVVDERSQSKLSESIPETPLVNISNTISQASESLSNNLPTSPSISVTPISTDATNSIQRQLESDQLSQKESLQIESEMPVVSERSQPKLSESIPETPLVKLSNNIEKTNESSSPTISVTPISNDSTNPIQRRLESEQLSQNESLEIESEMPVVSERSQPKLSESIPETPLVKLSNNIEKTNESSSPTISVTPISNDSTNRIQRKLESEQLSQANQWVKLEPEMPVIYERSQPKLSESIPETPLVKLSNNIEKTNESSSPTISVTPISNDSTNRIQRKLESEQLSQANQWVKLEPEMPVIYERSQSKLSDSIPEKPLVNLSNTVDKTNESTSPEISVTPISNESTNPIQWKLESEQLSQANQWVKLEPEMPVIYERSQSKLSESIPETPLVNLSNTVDQTKESSSPEISVTPISAESTNIIQRRLESKQLSQQNQLIKFAPKMPVVSERSQQKLSEAQQNQLIKFAPKMPVVSERSQQKLSEAMPETPLVKLSNTLDGTIESPLNNIDRTQSNNLPVVEVTLERSPPEFEPLILSASPPLAKQKASSLNGNELTTEKPSIAPAKYNATPSTQHQTSIANSTTSNISTSTSTSARNSPLPQVNQTTQISLAGVNIPPQIDVDALAEKVERKIMRRLVVESERRGKKKWR